MTRNKHANDIGGGRGKVTNSGSEELKRSTNSLFETSSASEMKE